ncbi:hypothetical protein GGX14DRAFT_553555 [Mycena pura]|uniref:Uncharacterized protein n=1 Tax=Mycena pura TaxID=153505 RepID=A0AAD6YV11_9AGAR|nr:hypothetical protein GGX14DRAFT_553555 [Mycena pura]
MSAYIEGASMRLFFRTPGLPPPCPPDAALLTPIMPNVHQPLSACAHATQAQRRSHLRMRVLEHRVPCLHRLSSSSILAIARVAWACLRRPLSPDAALLPARCATYLQAPTQRVDRGRMSRTTVVTVDAAAASGVANANASGYTAVPAIANVSFFL